jgi:hypothetical protein
VLARAARANNLFGGLVEGTMNQGWILFHLREAHEELTRTIAKINAAATVDEIEFEIALAHMYNHLNTAWNSHAASDEQIAAQTDDDFYRWRGFPADICLGR